VLSLKEIEEPKKVSMVEKNKRVNEMYAEWRLNNTKAIDGGNSTGGA
jgi:hypothetical protein